MAVIRTPVAVFARAPRPGHAKTRLAPALGAGGAAKLAAAFLEDTLGRCRTCAELDVTLWAAGDPEDPDLVRLAGPIRRQAQPPGDLGERMGAALEHMIARADRGLLVGSDVPTLPAAYLSAAAGALDRTDLVLGPSADGGYYLVGAGRRVPPVFEGIRWSSRHTLADTLERAARHGLRPVLLPPWYDVDTPADLRLLRVHLALERAAAPATARSLGL